MKKGSKRGVFSGPFPILIALALILAGCQQPAPPTQAAPPATTEPSATPTVPTSTPEPTATPTITPTATPVPIEIIPAEDISHEQITADYPRVDGSTSTHPLQVTLACQLYGISCGWMEDLFFGERRVFPDPITEENIEEANQVIGIQHNGTHGSYMNLIGGEADFILVARAPSEDELREAEFNQVGLVVTPIALDAFVFLVNEANPVESLSLEQLRDIYQGKITNWSEVGGVNEPIQAFQRDPNSGSQELMEALVMKGAPMIDAPDMILLSMIGPLNAVGEDPLGIGYSVYYYATYMLPDERVRLLGVEGVLPTPENIATRRYPLTTEVYAVLREGTPADSSAVMLYSWLLGEEGQNTVGKSGYVPIH
jgi:phosphate transport system substrate-binding protein